MYIDGSTAFFDLNEGRTRSFEPLRAKTIFLDDRTPM